MRWVRVALVTLSVDLWGGGILGPPALFLLLGCGMSVSKADLEDHIAVLEGLIDGEHDQLADLLGPIIDTLETILSQQDAREVAQNFVDRWRN